MLDYKAVFPWLNERQGNVRRNRKGGVLMSCVEFWPCGGALVVPVFLGGVRIMLGLSPRLTTNALNVTWG